ncbi:alginate export protein [Prosthecobacter fusiformis]|uniref:Alginate export protein n=1 Tax=Prosthecobacter fusiformis TaxID=48464 RepID=A0A4R7S0Q3_9BACT|nr:alginate export family protein [Prosthecobacter fusiformis]TDU70745.1 alginate export protein [Prosthecobacter fusiformis]
MNSPFIHRLAHLKAMTPTILVVASFVVLASAEETKKESYYRAPKSYSTTRDTDVPRYARRASEIGWDTLKNADWLDLGLDYRFRYEHRDDDLRRNQAILDEPLLHRTRAYLGIRDILDPFRFAVEMQDSRRYNGNFPKDNRDVNEFQIIRLYAELYFDDALGTDAFGNKRPLSIRYGIHNFEFLDRRLIGNNQWRNTANAFQGFQGALGQESNDCQLDLLAVQPLDRLLYGWDRPVKEQWFYAAIGHWRRWSDIITLEPYYLALNQSAYDEVEERLVHSPGLRGYGTVGKTGFDYDFSLTYQFGYNGARDVKAYAGTAEIGYSFKQPWSPRLSFFYGYASGDRDPNDNEDNRFERFFGFGRPWSANDYIVYENISTPKLRLELTPSKKVRMDLGYSYYWVASDKDRFSGGGLRDPQGNSGSMIGHEFDGRIRWQVTPKVEAILGYAHFTPGDFTRNQGRPDDTDFAYLEISIKAF